jgi:hypothetical protein
MRYTRPGGWTDLAEHSFLRQPNIIVKAEDADLREIITEADLYCAGGKNRHVIYEDSSEVRWSLELVPYLHPAGAGPITLGSIAYSALNVATFTISCEGRLINETGDLVAASEEAEDVAGLLIGDYYYHIQDNADLLEAHRATTIEEGDFLWLIRRGLVYLDSTAAVTNNDDLMSSATVAGEVEPSTALNTAGTIAQYDATLWKHIYGDGNPRGYALATAMETTGGAGLAKARLLLPPRHYRTNA